MREPDRDWNRQRFRAKHFDRARTRAKFDLTTIDDCCDSILRLEFDSITLNATRSCPRLRQLKDTKQQKSKIDCEQRESKSLIQSKCRRQCCYGAGKVWRRFLRERRNTFPDERHCRSCLNGRVEQRLQ